jgi:hypothetical protein
MYQKVSKQAHGKVIVMILFLVMDLGLNSTLDYDVLNDQRANNILLGVFGLQVVVQISICLILFLAAADTYLFRVGLLGILLRSISIVLISHPLYMALTIAVGAYRVRQMSGTGSLATLWKDDTFITISFIQKLRKFIFFIFICPVTCFTILFFTYVLVAVPYYIANIRTTIKLEDPMYFNKSAWIGLIKQVSCVSSFMVLPAALFSLFILY